MSDAVMVPRGAVSQIKARLMSYLFGACQPDHGSVFGWFDDHADEALEFALRDALAASTPVGGWEDISTAPRDLVVQMYEPHSQGGFMFAGCIGIDGSYRDNLRGDALNPTHWMPLPEAPKGGEA